MLFFSNITSFSQYRKNPCGDIVIYLFRSKVPVVDRRLTISNLPKHPTPIIMNFFNLLADLCRFNY